MCVPENVVSRAPWAQPRRYRRFGRLACHERRRTLTQPVAAPTDVEYVQIAGRRHVRLHRSTRPRHACRLVECTSRSVVATTLCWESATRVPSCRRTQRDPASTWRRPWAAIAESFCRSSSLPTRTSPCSTMRPRTETARCRRPRRSTFLAIVQDRTTPPPRGHARPACLRESRRPCRSDNDAKCPAVNQRTPDPKRSPLKVARLQPRGRFVNGCRTRRPAPHRNPVAIDRRHVGSVYPSCAKRL